MQLHVTLLGTHDGQAWALCRIGEHCLSNECMTSRTTLERLRALPQSMPEFWTELTGASTAEVPGAEPDPVLHDQTADDTTDDTSAPTAHLVDQILGHPRNDLWSDESGALAPTSTAESDMPEKVFGEGDGMGAGGPDTGASDGMNGAVSAPAEVESNGDDADLYRPSGSASGSVEPRNAPRRGTRANREPGWYKRFDDWEI